MAKKMTDEEREELVAKMDKDLENFISEKASQSKPVEDMFKDMTVDEIAEELKSHPAFMTEFDPSKPMSPAMEAMQQLKYEGGSDIDKADSYKEDGNQNFKNKKYRWAIDSYSQGIKEKCSDRQLNAILYTNRAAANFHLGNYRSSLRDVTFAIKFKPTHMKAIVRGAQCCMEIKKFNDAKKWCDMGLEINPDEPKLLEMRSQADKLKRQQERDKRKELAKERKEEQQEKQLIETIKSRGVTLAGIEKGANVKDQLILSKLESTHPSGAKVHLDDQGVLHWPVMFLYPEYAETDFIQSFGENDTLADHLEYMFGPQAEPAPWDSQRKYKINNIQIYFENVEEEKMYRLKQTIPLHQILQHKGYVVQGGTPAFIVLVKDSEYAKSFLAKYKS